MISIFKKTKKEVEEVVIENTKQKYPLIVEQIHSEFASASEVLLKEAQIIINQASTIDTSKVDRLKSIGFNQSREVTKIEPMIQKALSSEKTIEYIQEYKNKFPEYKFITEDMVQEICYKYNLIFGDISKYKGFVPDKNLREIEQFKNKYKSRIAGIYTGRQYNTRETVFLDLTGFIFEKGDRYNYIRNPNHRSFLQQDMGRGYFYGPIYDANGVYFNGSNVCPASLKICAPVKDMDLTRVQIKNGYKMEDIPDPVVLQPIAGGYLILTAWGDEAEDDLVKV